MARKYWLLLAAAFVLALGAVVGVWALGPVILTALADLQEASARPETIIVVEASYPEANADVVESTVAAPIEQQVMGVENMLDMTSRCESDGRYTLRVAFARGTDPRMAQVLVQNRVALAEPMLPDLVKRTGTSVRLTVPYPLLFVALSSPSRRYDETYLARYASVSIKDELVRFAGVAGVTVVGHREIQFCIKLNPDQLASRKLTAADVLDLLRTLVDQNTRAEAGRGQTIVLITPGRLVDNEKWGAVIIKADSEGRATRLGDVASIEAEIKSPRSRATLDAKPIALLSIDLLPGARRADAGVAVLDKLSELRTNLPDGLDLSTVFDFTENRAAAAECLALDVDLPEGESKERTLAVVEHCDKILRETAGIEHVLTLTGPPFARFDHQALVLVRHKQCKGREQREAFIARVRVRLRKEIADAEIRLRASADHPLADYPIHFALCGDDYPVLSEQAERLATQLRESDRLTDVCVSRASFPRSQRTIDIDRSKASEAGVPMDAILDTLRVALGMEFSTPLDVVGQRSVVSIRTDNTGPAKPEDLGKLKVRSSTDEMVPLSSFIQVRSHAGPRAIDRLDGRRMVEFTANPAPGISVAQGREDCETLWNKIGARPVRLTWIGNRPPRK